MRFKRLVHTSIRLVALEFNSIWFRTKLSIQILQKFSHTTSSDSICLDLEHGIKFNVINFTGNRRMIKTKN